MRTISTPPMRTASAPSSSGSASRDAGASQCVADSPPVAAPMVEVSRAARATRASAISSSEAPGWAFRSRSASRIGSRGAAADSRSPRGARGDPPGAASPAGGVAVASRPGGTAAPPAPATVPRTSRSPVAADRRCVPVGSAGGLPAVPTRPATASATARAARPSPVSSGAGAGADTGRGGGTSRAAPMRGSRSVIGALLAPSRVPPGACQGWEGRAPLSGAVPAEQLVTARRGEPAAVLHQEAARAGELVLLLGEDADRQLLAGQVGAGELQVLVEVGLVDVDRCGLRLGASCLELLERVLTQLVGFIAARGVVVGGHGVPLPGVLAGIVPARLSRRGECAVVLAGRGGDRWIGGPAARF